MSATVTSASQAVNLHFVVAWTLMLSLMSITGYIAFTSNHPPEYDPMRYVHKTSGANVMLTDHKRDLHHLYASKTIHKVRKITSTGWLGYDNEAKVKEAQRKNKRHGKLRHPAERMTHRRLNGEKLKGPRYQDVHADFNKEKHKRLAVILPDRVIKQIRRTGKIHKRHKRALERFTNGSQVVMTHHDNAKHRSIATVKKAIIGPLTKTQAEHSKQTRAIERNHDRVIKNVHKLVKEKAASDGSGSA